MGRRAEDLAHRWLSHQGVQIVARNFRSRTGRGEIDLVGWEGDSIVFYEVKSRGDESFRSAEANVGEEKQRMMLRTAGEYLRRARVPHARARFDVVAVVFDRPAPSLRRHALPISLTDKLQ